MTTLRPYQQRALDQLYAWFEQNPEGNPCIVAPTGSGKSHIIAAFCRNALQEFPETKILMLTHVKELIQQNASKMREHWPDAPLGIFSASMGKKDLGKEITFAGIQSIRKRAEQLGHIDIILIDECHLVSHNDEGSYRKLITDLTIINPHLRVIGLTATPFRLGHGLITDKPAIFDALIEPVSIESLVEGGYLSTLRSTRTALRLDTSDVHKRGGEFIESELQKAIDTEKNNREVVEEVLKLAGDRKAWLFFCAGVDHAHHISHLLNESGIVSECVTGETHKKDREKILDDFKAGKIQAVTNANVLTTGFDHPDIDLLVMLRPTMSASLYVQMAGRGMRPKSHTDHCLVLDFAGNVAMHGPVTNVQPSKKKGEGEGDPPTKVCSECHEICHISAKICPNCKEPFPPPPERKFILHNDDIMGVNANGELAVRSWTWRKQISRTSGKPMLSCTYYGGLSDKPVTEYLTVGYMGYAGEKAMRTLYNLAQASGALLTGAESMSQDEGLTFLADQMNKARPPSSITFKLDGKFYQILTRSWSRATQKTDIFSRSTEVLSHM
jgi:DNA repair protein RadD